MDANFTATIRPTPRASGRLAARGGHCVQMAAPAALPRFHPAAQSEPHPSELPFYSLEEK
jgi:hypothetical protein